MIALVKHFYQSHKIKVNWSVVESDFWSFQIGHISLWRSSCFYILFDICKHPRSSSGNYTGCSYQVADYWYYLDTREIFFTEWQVPRLCGCCRFPVHASRTIIIWNIAEYMLTPKWTWYTHSIFIRGLYSTTRCT